MTILENEKEIVIRLTQGNKEAFCVLYAAYKTAVVRFVLRMLKSKELAEDIFQDAFVVIWQSRQFINPESLFSAYLFTIVKNRVLNILREEENQSKLKAVADAAMQEETHSTRDTILQNDLMGVLQQAKETLTPKQREVYELSREAHLSHQEIAERLQISPHTVREHITMALKQIRLFLRKYGYMATSLIFFFSSRV